MHCYYAAFPVHGALVHGCGIGLLADVAVCLSVCLLGSNMSCAKLAELIMVPFGLQTSVDPTKNRALHECPDTPWEGSILRIICAGLL